MYTKFDIKFLERAYNSRMQTLLITNKIHIDVKEFLSDVFVLFNDLVGAILLFQHVMKVGSCLTLEYQKENNSNMKQYITTPMEILDIDTNFVEWYEANVLTKCLKKLEDFEANGSGWTLHSITDIQFFTNQYDVHKGSSYIKLPKALVKKGALVNVQNFDEFCFVWAVLSCLYPASTNPQRKENYIKYINKLNLTGLRFPLAVNQIHKFEQLNPEISVNVYLYNPETKLIESLRISPKEIRNKHVNLLLITDLLNMENDQVDSEIIGKRMHYVWIKSMSRLLSSQISKSKAKVFICDRCLLHFTSYMQRHEHIAYCRKQNHCKIEMPLPGKNIIKFKNHKNQLQVPFIIYADIESLLKKPENENFDNGTTKIYQHHETYSVGYYFKSMYDDSMSYYRSNRGPQCIQWFVTELKNIALSVTPILRQVKEMNLSEIEKKSFENAKICHICSKKFSKNDIKVRDHNHITGSYRGAAHQDCNILFQDSKTIPVVFHNLSGYDSHFFITELCTSFPGEVQIIPINDQQYISFTKTVDEASFGKKNNHRETVKLKFIDSFRFMASSLDKLSSYLPSEKKKVLHKEFNYLEQQKRSLLERKGVFPYDYVDSWHKLDDTELPSKKDFYSRLTENEISDEEYQFSKLIWNTFNIKTLGEYADLYLKTDILLLSDVFENFRETCLRIYKLDPAHYYTSPGFSWDSMLKYTDIDIELFTDIDMLLFVERGIRGGISQCSQRYSKANNKYMSDYDPSKASSYLMYLDVNNLYGYAMMQHLPINGYEWCNVDIETIIQTSNKSPNGYILEVDLEYPQHLHDSHKDYPLCAESRTPPNGKNKKLMLTLYDKKNYVIHYEMLKFVLKQGLVLKKVHRVLKFNQAPWLEPYILLNTQQRTIATNDFEKNLYKLMSNAVYGKTMENVRSRVDIKIKSAWHGRYGAAQLIARPNFKKRTIFSENCVAIEMEKTSIKMDKPIAIGMCVLDISKVVMCEFHYDHMKQKYHENVEILYTDTDSFVYRIECEDYYSDMNEDLHLYDTSDFPLENIYNIPRTNKKVPGLMKDENNGKCMTEFVGLRSKMYSVRVDKKDAMKKAKGVKKYVLNKKINFNDYLDCIFKNCIIAHDQNSIRSKSHQVFTIQQKKIALSGKDDKRYILENGITTLPWGHYSLIQ